MKSSENFKKIISAHLEFTALRDPLFAKTLKKENKSIDECINYILETVQKSGCNGFDDNEIYKMAIHYYDEDDIKAKGNNNISVVVNHKIPLSFEEIKKAKEKALNDIIKAETERLTKKKTTPAKPITAEETNSLFDEAEN